MSETLEARFALLEEQLDTALKILDNHSRLIGMCNKLFMILSGWDEDIMNMAMPLLKEDKPDKKRLDELSELLNEKKYISTAKLSEYILKFGENSYECSKAISYCFFFMAATLDKDRDDMEKMFKYMQAIVDKGDLPTSEEIKQLRLDLDIPIIPRFNGVSVKDKGEGE